MTWEDQKNINTFSKMNTRRHELEGLIAGTKVPSKAMQRCLTGARLSTRRPRALCARTRAHRGCGSESTAPQGAEDATSPCGCSHLAGHRVKGGGAAPRRRRSSLCGAQWSRCTLAHCCSQKDLEDLEDASAELVIADEEDDGGSGGGGVRLRVGTAFLHVPKEEAEERVEALSGEAKERLGHLQEEAGGVETKLAELKATLYARLGKGNINLEE